jgi:hypothetical protein
MEDIDISNLSARKHTKSIILAALQNGDNVIRNGHYIVNNIGITTYISYEHLTPTELRAIANYKQFQERVKKHIYI